MELSSDNNSSKWLVQELSCTLNVHVHDGDQLYRGVLIFKTEANKESALQHNWTVAFELTFAHVHGK